MNEIAPVAVLTDSVPVEPTPVVTPTPTPSPDPAPVVEPVVTPTAPVDPVDPVATPAEVLYDLPDGRKVDAATLAREFKENFLPDYTQKSQKLADIEKGKHINTPSDPNLPAWKQPDFVPGSWEEVIELATQEAANRSAQKAQEEKAQQDKVTQEVDNQIIELKKTDPTLDENLLFQHANKFGFRDLKLAHANMTEMKSVALTTEQRVLKNIQNRATDPIATTPGVTTPTTGVDLNAISHFRSAQEYLASLKK